MSKYSVNSKEMDRLMLEYKRTGDQEIFTLILKKMRGIILQQSNLSDTKRTSNLNDREDFESMAMEFLWTALKNYRFICPVCGIVAKNEEAYRKHLKLKHRCGSNNVRGKKVKVAIPYSSIYFYTVAHIEKRLTNIIRDEGKFIRKANSFDVRYSGTTSDEDESVVNDPLLDIESSLSVEDIFITKNTINEMMDKLQKEQKKIHEFVLKGLLDGSTNKDLAITLYNAKMYKSLESAKSTVSKVLSEIKTMYLKLAV